MKSYLDGVTYTVGLRSQSEREDLGSSIGVQVLDKLRDLGCIAEPQPLRDLAVREEQDRCGALGRRHVSKRARRLQEFEGRGQRLGHPSTGVGDEGVVLPHYGLHHIR